MIGTIIHTETRKHAFTVTSDGGTFRTYKYENGEGRPELIGTGHDARSAMSFIALHAGSRPKRRGGHG